MSIWDLLGFVPWWGWACAMLGIAVILCLLLPSGPPLMPSDPPESTLGEWRRQFEQDMGAESGQDQARHQKRPLK